MLTAYWLLLLLHLLILLLLLLRSNASTNTYSRNQPRHNKIITIISTCTVATNTKHHSSLSTQ